MNEVSNLIQNQNESLNANPKKPRQHHFKNFILSLILFVIAILLIIGFVLLFKKDKQDIEQPNNPSNSEKKITNLDPYIHFYYTSVKLEKSQQVNITKYLTYRNISLEEITITSSDDSIVVVENGIIKAKGKEGKAILTASYKGKETKLTVKIGTSSAEEDIIDAINNVKSSSSHILSYNDIFDHSIRKFYQGNENGYMVLYNSCADIFEYYNSPYESSEDIKISLDNFNIPKKNNKNDITILDAFINNMKMVTKKDNVYTISLNDEEILKKIIIGNMLSATTISDVKINVIIENQIISSITISGIRHNSVFSENFNLQFVYSDFNISEDANYTTKCINNFNEENLKKVYTSTLNYNNYSFKIDYALKAGPDGFGIFGKLYFNDTLIDTMFSYNMSAINENYEIDINKIDYLFSNKFIKIIKGIDNQDYILCYTYHAAPSGTEANVNILNKEGKILETLVYAYGGVSFEKNEELIEYKKGDGVFLGSQIVLKVVDNVIYYYDFSDYFNYNYDKNLSAREYKITINNDKLNYELLNTITDITSSGGH